MKAGAASSATCKIFGNLESRQQHHDGEKAVMKETSGLEKRQDQQTFDVSQPVIH